MVERMLFIGNARFAVTAWHTKFMVLPQSANNQYLAQFHPEYQSTVQHPHPLFVALVEAAAHSVAAAKVLQTEDTMVFR